jgi:hypothetical protein
MNRLLFNLKANDAHGLHSPFIYEIYTKVINPSLHKSGDLALNLAKDLSNYQVKSSLTNNFYVQIIDINELKLADKNLNKHAILLIKNIRNHKKNNLWEEIIRNEKIIFSIELYEIGMLFFDPIAPKQHFTFKKSKLE